MHHQQVRVFAGGFESSPCATNVIEYVEIATTGNAVDFGDLKFCYSICCWIV